MMTKIYINVSYIYFMNDIFKNFIIKDNKLDI